jgi:hypothetical protein
VLPWSTSSRPTDIRWFGPTSRSQDDDRPPPPWSTSSRSTDIRLREATSGTRDV